MIPTNPSLIRRVRNLEDAASWREFVELYEPLLVSYVRSRGLNAVDAADIVQDIFINLLRALPNFSLDRERGRFRTWLWQVTMNAIADSFRRRNSQGRAEGVWRTQAPTSTTDQPDDAWLAAHKARVLEYVLPKVQAATVPKTWYCFEKHVLGNRPGVEIAKELGITANAVCVNANRVMEKVRALCAEYMEEPGDDNDNVPG